MRRNKHPNECPTCEKIPCQCAGGGAADDEKSKKEGEATVDSKRDASALSNSANGSVLDSQQTANESRQHISLFDEKNQLVRCMLFGSAANQPTPTPSNQLQEENGTNSENTSMGMGMKMGSTDE